VVDESVGIHLEDEIPDIRFQPKEDVAARVPGASFETMMRLVRTHPLVTDAFLTAALLFLSTVWLLGFPAWGLQAALLQCGLVLPLVARRAQPSATFGLICIVAFVQWVLGYQLIADFSLLVALYTVAAYESTSRSLVAAVILEA